MPIIDRMDGSVKVVLQISWSRTQVLSIKNQMVNRSPSGATCVRIPKAQLS